MGYGERYGHGTHNGQSGGGHGERGSGHGGAHGQGHGGAYGGGHPAGHGNGPYGTGHGSGHGSGYGLLVAATPPGRHPAVDATEALPALAAAPPAMLLGTDAGNVVQLADPADPNTVLSHLRTAAAHDGPLLLYFSGQLVLDPREHRPHLALTRSTPRTVRYTGLPWHWLLAEFGHRPLGLTTLVADLVADDALWRQRTRHRLDSGLELYGCLTAPPGRRGTRVPEYSRAVAAVLRASRVRPHAAELHRLALHQAGFGPGDAERMVLGDVSGTAPVYGAAPVHGAAPLHGAPPFAATPGPTAVPAPARPAAPPAPRAPDSQDAQGAPAAPAAPGAVSTGGAVNSPAPASPATAPAVPPVPAPEPPAAPGPAGTDGSTPAPAPAVQDPVPGPGRGAGADAGAGTGAGENADADAVPVPDPVQVADPDPVQEPEPAQAPAPVPDSAQAPVPVPDPAGVPERGGSDGGSDGRRPLDVPPGVHDAIYTAAREGRHTEAATLAAQWETAALRSSGPHSREAVHWVEVRADLAHRAGEPARACTLWLQAAALRLQTGQPAESPDVTGAVDRAHHCWHQVTHRAQAYPLGLQLAELRARAPGSREGAVQDVQDRLALLASGRDVTGPDGRAAD